MPKRREITKVNNQKFDFSIRQKGAVFNKDYKVQLLYFIKGTVLHCYNCCVLRGLFWQIFILQLFSPILFCLRVVLSSYRLTAIKQVRAQGNKDNHELHWFHIQVKVKCLTFHTWWSCGDVYWLFLSPLQKLKNGKVKSIEFTDVKTAGKTQKINFYIWWAQPQITVTTWTYWFWKYWAAFTFQRKMLGKTLKVQKRS